MKLSVIICVYNTEKSYLEKCLDSISSSTLHDYEIVIIDDGSTEDYSEILTKYKVKYSKTENKEEISDLLDRLWDYFHDHRSWNLCISGSDENWNDESNALTYEILAMVRKKGYQTPNLTCRVHKNTPEKLWNAIAETLAIGTFSGLKSRPG